MSKITGIIIAKNEEEMIADCIDSLAFCDEILVIDNNSTDRTVEIAKHLKATVIESKADNFADRRNLGLAKAKNEWVLYIDADERVDTELQEEILAVVKSKRIISVYRVSRKNFYFGTFEWPIVEKLERFFRKSALKEWKGDLHESPVYEGEVSDLPGYLNHYTHRDLESMVEKTNHWSEMEAKLRFDAHHPPMAQWRFFSVMFRTFFRYFIKDKGYKAGVAGLVESIYQVFSMFITYAKLWELQQAQKKKE